MKKTTLDKGNFYFLALIIIGLFFSFVANTQALDVFPLNTIECRIIDTNRNLFCTNESGDRAYIRVSYYINGVWDDNDTIAVNDGVNDGYEGVMNSDATEIYMLQGTPIENYYYSTSPDPLLDEYVKLTYDTVNYSVDFSSFSNFCEIGNWSYCTTQESCEVLDYFWDGSSCLESRPVDCSLYPEDCDTQESCQDDDWYWSPILEQCFFDSGNDIVYAITTNSDLILISLLELKDKVDYLNTTIDSTAQGFASLIGLIYFFMSLFIFGCVAMIFYYVIWRLF